MKHLFKLLAITLFLSAHSYAQNTWTPHNSGTVNIIADISFPTNDTGYAISDVGQIRKTVNGATTWTGITQPPTVVYSIFFTSGLVGYAAADSMIYKTTNGGASWTTVMHNNQNIFGAMFFLNASTGYATSIDLGMDSARLFKTVNGGTTWTKMATKVDHGPFQGIYYLNSTSGFWGLEADVFSTTNSGSSFANVYTDITGNDGIINFAFPDVNTGFGVGMNDLLIKSTNGGASWTEMTYPGSASYDLYFPNPYTGYVCGGNGFNSGWVQVTGDQGATWTPMYTSSYSFYCMDFPSDTIGYVGGDNGTVVKYSGTPLGISENQNQHRLNIFPNPANGFVNITNAIPGSRITIMDLSGKIIQEQIAENSELKMGIEKLDAGIYFVQMESGNEKCVQKLIVE